MPKIRINNAILSYPSLFKKAVYKGAETKYETSFILDKKEHSEEIKTIQKEIEKLLNESFNTTRAKFKDDNICLKDGDFSNKDYLSGKFIIKATNDLQPLLVDYAREIILEKDNPQKFYSGVIANGVIDLYALSNNYGKKILANLYGVQFVKDGIRLGSNALNIQNTINDFDILEPSSFDIPFSDNIEENDLF